MLSGSGGAGAPLIPLEAALAVCEEHGMVPEQVCVWQVALLCHL
jgi:hypothetical protein